MQKKPVRKVAAVVAGAVLAAVLAPVTPASAAFAQSSNQQPVLTVVHGSSQTDASQTKGVTLRCGGAFLGGGGYVSAPRSQNVGLTQIAPGTSGSWVVNDPTSMRVSAQAAPESAPANWTLHAYGICAIAGLRGVEYQSNYVSAWREGRQSPLWSSVQCSPGKRLVGMGAQSFAIPGQVRLSSLGGSTRWAWASVHTQPTPSASWAVQSIAVCADHQNAHAVSGLTDIDHRDPKPVAAHCPTGQHPTAAGFNHRLEGGNLMQHLLIPISGGVVGNTQTDTRAAPGQWGGRTTALCLPATRL